MFKIGIGPSSSHTVGPMIAALEFRRVLEQKLAEDKLTNPLRIQAELFGSLSATGTGHGTDGATCAGLTGLDPKTASPDDIWGAMPKLKENPRLEVGGHAVRFHPDEDLVWKEWFIDEKPLPHPNTLRFRLFSGDTLILEQIWLSVGGGFVEQADPETGLRRPPQPNAAAKNLPYPFNSACEFVDQCFRNDKPAWEIVIANEAAKGMDEKTLRTKLSEILQTFKNCIERGLSNEGILPGGLNVRRRAKALYAQMKEGKTPAWSAGDLRPSIYAMAVNEENAAGGRVVTAPTNGSSGLIPAVWRTLEELHGLSEETMQNGLMVASVVGALVKTHASISGAEVGCQGEVGTSCAMAAAGAVAMLGGTADQIEQAAEIGIEHHLGMTCDPIMGLVQVPCIERNAMGAVKALNAAALSLASDGQHLVSLDKVLAVMKQTGIDMNQKYKETATGGLALG